MKTLKRYGYGATALCLAGPAYAHTFLAEGGVYDRFVEGTLVVLAYPATLLPLLALGILTSLWQSEGLIRAWPVFLVGQVIGIGVAAMAGPWIVTTLMGFGVLVAALAALLPRFSGGEVRIAAGITGILAVGASLEGHRLFELPPAIYLGILFAANLAVAMSAGLARIMLERNTSQWMRILWRTAASWIAAILILYFAFTVTA